MMENSEKLQLLRLVQRAMQITSERRMLDKERDDVIRAARNMGIPDKFFTRLQMHWHETPATKAKYEQERDAYDALLTELRSVVPEELPDYSNVQEAAE